MVTLRALKVFAIVVEHGSISSAARALHLSQPALSHHLMTLEREIGAPLLERSSRGVHPTPTGLALLPGARAAVDTSARAVSSARSVAAGVTGSLRIAVAESLVVPLVAPVLRHWIRTRPTITIELTEANHAQAVLQTVEAGLADVGVTARWPSVEGHTTVIRTEQALAVLPPGHELEQQTTVGWADLAHEGIVHYEPLNGLAAWIDEAAAAHGVLLEATVRTRAAATAVSLASVGIGIALVPESALSFPVDDLVTRPLDPPLVRELIAVTKTAANGLVADFIADLGTVAQRWRPTV